MTEYDGICKFPGGRREKFDLDSFLFPFFVELKWLGEGVAAYDAHTNMYFSLKAFVCLVTGDTPAILKLFKLSGNTGTYPCRACKISSTPYLNWYLTKSGANKGEAGKNIRGYYPLSPPRYPSTNGKGYLSSLPTLSWRSPLTLSWRLHQRQQSRFGRSKPTPYIWYQGCITIYTPSDDIFPCLRSIWHHAFSFPELCTRPLRLI